MRPSLRTWGFLVVALFVTAPAWIVKHPPLQDVPFHLATLRLLHDSSNPDYGFAEVYRTNWLGTQYLLYYGIGHLLSFVVGVFRANIVLMSFYLGGTLLAVRALLRTLGKDERIALFAIPLLVNTMFRIGLLPFVFGFPFLLWGLATAIRYFEEPTLRRGLALGVLSVAIFYSHIIVFGAFGLALALLFPWTKPGFAGFGWLRFGAPVVPSLGLVGWWMRSSEGGKVASLGLKMLFTPKPLSQSMPDIPHAMVDLFFDESDEIYLVLLGAIVLVALGMSSGDKEKISSAMRRFWIVPLAFFGLYFLTGDDHPVYWLFSMRFPILGALTTLAVLRFPKGLRGAFVTVCALGIGMGSIVNTCRHFIRFELEEVGDIDGALAAIGPKKKVAGLIFDKGSQQIPLAPFLHFVSYYQLEYGGVVQFSYVGFPHWPVHYLPEKHPPNSNPLRLRWEWTPEQVTLDELYPYYDAVLVRGSGFRPPQGTFHTAWHRGPWTVWLRD